MKLLAALKTPKILFVPLAAASIGGSYYVYTRHSASTIEKAVLDTITRPYEFKNSSGSPDTATSRNKEHKNIKPFNDLPSVTVYYTQEEESKLENSVSNIYTDRKATFSDKSVTQKQYGAWCDVLFFGHLKDSKEYETWTEKCWNSKSKDNISREHMNSWLKIKYPKGLYEKTGVFAGWDNDSFTPSNSQHSVKCGELFKRDTETNEKTGFRECKVVFPPVQPKSPKAS